MIDGDTIKILEHGLARCAFDVDMEYHGVEHDAVQESTIVELIYTVDRLQKRFRGVAPIIVGDHGIPIRWRNLLAHPKVMARRTRNLQRKSLDDLQIDPRTSHWKWGRVA